MHRTVLASSVRVGFETLRANPLRTLLSTLGIIMGVASLVSVLSLGDGIERYGRLQIERTTDLQMVMVGTLRFRMVQGQAFPLADPVQLTAADADSLRAVAGPGAATALLVRGAALATTRRDTTPRVTALIGAQPSIQAMRELRLAAGRFYRDDERALPVAVVNAPLAAELAPGRPASALVGDSVLLLGRPHLVVGVLAADTAMREKEALLPPDAAMPILAAGAQPPMPAVVVKAATIEQVEPTRVRIERWVANRYGPRWSERVSVKSNRGRAEQASQAVLLFKLLMGALTGISLLVGGIGIMNVLLASVAERTREIGIRRATGAQRRHILVQFLSESVTISGVGSVVGIVLGLAAAYGVTAIMRHTTGARVFAAVSASTLATGVIASVAVGMLFGLYPARRAANLSPIEAMYHE